MKKSRAGFTFLELVFVIVVMGIIAKFGVEFLAKAYENYLYQHISNTLQNRSEAAVNFIATRLQYRIKDSVIIRNPTTNDFVSLEGNNSAVGYDILEWIGYDIEGFRGDENASPLWSGLLDKEYGYAGNSDLHSPGTDTKAVDTYIQTLRSQGSATTIDDAAIYIMNSDSDVKTDYGWDGNAITDQNHSMHPINQTTNKEVFVSPPGNTEDFSTLNVRLKDVRYKLAWSAYAVVYTPGTNYDGTLTFYYDYQPWNGETYVDGKSVLIMEHVSSFRKRQSFRIMKIQVCTKSEFAAQASATDMEKYSVCQEKTIY